jgi:ATP-dependent RNA helicase RhlE
MNKLTLALTLALISIIVSNKAYSQKDTLYFPISIEVNHNATQLPGSGYLGFINTPIHPGVTIGTYKSYFAIKKHSLSQTFKLGYMYHQYSHTAFQLTTELSYSYAFSESFNINANLGVGNLYSFTDVDAFQLTVDSVYKKKNLYGRSQFTGGFLLGLNYTIIKESKAPITLFFNYRFWLQAPFVKQYVPVLPYTTISLGAIIYIEKNKKNEVLVLDEADHMLDLGFIKDIRDLIRFLPKERQTLFFSATINDRIKRLAYSLVQNPIRIEISPKDPVAKNITHSLAFIEMDDKRFFLERVINENPESKILVFVRTKVRAERVLKAMERVKIESQTIHSDKVQKSRLSVMNMFKSGENKVLIATDVSARGIDIPNVDYVINYDLPEKAENYVHRVGRTGRGNKKGLAVSFCSNEEKEILAEIEQFLGKKINILEIDKKDYSDTLDFTAERNDTWQTLLDEDERLEKLEKEFKKKKRKKR